MTPSDSCFDAVTVTLNPAIDRTVTIRDFKAGAVNRVEASIDAPGGKGVNVAAALADHALRVAVTGFLGQDNSLPFDSLFSQKGITDRFVRLTGQTRVGIKIVDSARSDTTEINFPGLPPSAADLDQLRLRLSSLNSAWVVLAGSLPPGVACDFYPLLIAGLKARGVQVALDTSGDALAAAIASAPTLIKPNLHELATLAGRPMTTRTEIVRTARELVAGGVKLVAVSLGAQGAVFVNAEECVFAEAPVLRAARTVGAGDAMVAGLVAAQVQGLPLGPSAQLATAFAIRYLAQQNSEGAMVDLTLKALANRVTIQAS